MEKLLGVLHINSYSLQGQALKKQARLSLILIQLTLLTNAKLSIAHTTGLVQHLCCNASPLQLFFELQLVKNISPDRNKNAQRKQIKIGGKSTAQIFVFVMFQLPGILLFDNSTIHTSLAQSISLFYFSKAQLKSPTLYFSQYQ